MRSSERRRSHSPAFLVIGFLLLGALLGSACDGSHPVAPGTPATPTTTPTVTSTPVGGGLKKIVFTTGRTGNDEIFIMNADGSQPVQLTQNTLFDTNASFSFDGTKILFNHGPSSALFLEVFAMNPDGSAQINLTNSSENETGGAFSPDGSRIVFYRGDFVLTNHDLYIMDSNGGNLTKLTNASPTPTPSGPLLNTEGRFFDPSWSPDGTRISCTVIHSSGGSNKMDILTMDTNGQNRVNLTNSTTFAFNASPSWSPNGTQIVFMSDRDGNNEIYRMNSDGTGLLRLTTNSAEEHFPCWSPDGNYIAFTTNRDGNFEIYRMDPDGTNLVNLTRNPGYDRSFNMAWR